MPKRVVDEWKPDLWWYLLFVLLPDSVTDFNQNFTEEEILKAFKEEIEEIRHIRDSKEELHYMNAKIDFCRETGVPCDMHYIRR